MKDCDIPRPSGPPPEGIWELTNLVSFMSRCPTYGIYSRDESGPLWAVMSTFRGDTRLSLRFWKEGQVDLVTSRDGLLKGYSWVGVSPSDWWEALQVTSQDSS